MARIVLGVATSHSPMLSVPGELWPEFAQRDRANRELVFPPDGVSFPFDAAVEGHVPTEIRSRQGDVPQYQSDFARCQVALDALAETVAEVDADVTIIVSDDQDEWFYENNMPAFSIFWGKAVSVKPRIIPEDSSPFARYIAEGYGDIDVDLPVRSDLGGYLIEYLMDHDFDVSHVAYTDQMYGGKVKRRYPTPAGELDVVRETAPRPVGLPHGFSFVVKRLFDNRPRPILPVFQNTCYPPNHVRPHRAYDFGRAIGAAIAAWDQDLRVALVASGGLSHFVVDGELDRRILDAIVGNDEDALRHLPRHRLYSATSESLNWVAVAGALAETSLRAEIIDYVPVYRSEAGTGGGWGFARWR
jgi:3-O-methylgallate 3,4-dioxygenase